MAEQERYELKYLVSAHTRERILEASAHGLRPDPHGEQGIYQVTSQYYDTPDLLAYREKLDGVPFRRKYRIRFYGACLQAPVTFEVKCKSYDTVYKWRTPLPVEAARILLEDPGLLSETLDRLELDRASHREVCNGIELWAGRRALRPVNVISYRREAWLGEVDPGLRLTFDLFCRATSAGEAGWAAQGGGTPLLEGTTLLLEVKFDRRLPRWLRDALVHDHLHPVRFSKYARGIEVLRAATLVGRASGALRL